MILRGHLPAGLRRSGGVRHAFAGCLMRLSCNGVVPVKSGLQPTCNRAVVGSNPTGGSAFPQVRGHADDHGPSANSAEDTFRDTKVCFGCPKTGRDAGNDGARTARHSRPGTAGAARMTGHVVTVTHAADRVRAVCSCSWVSPWVTAGPPQPDIPPRDRIHLRAVKVAQWHVQTVRP